MTRFVVLAGIVAVLLVAVACGSGDTSLEDLGDEVQGTQVARATEDVIEGRTPEVTRTPEPTVVTGLQGMKRGIREIDGFFNFLELRLSGSGTISLGKIGDEEGTLASGWLADCCERQWDSVQEAVIDARKALSEMQAEYQTGGLVEQLDLLPGVQAHLDEAATALDALPAAAGLEEATMFVAAGRVAVAQLDAAMDDVEQCCDPTPEVATPTPTP